jgi:hypothetical protein
MKAQSSTMMESRTRQFHQTVTNLPISCFPMWTEERFPGELEHELSDEYGLTVEGDFVREDVVCAFLRCFRF